MEGETPSPIDTTTTSAHEIASNPSTLVAHSDLHSGNLSSTQIPPVTAATSIGDGGEPSTTNPTAKPTVDAQGRALNPRSCVTCRKRKVKCDKLHPCTNCNRAHIECVFPAPGRAPRKMKKALDGRDKELLERLRRLEGVVKGMGVDVELASGQANEGGPGEEARHELESKQRTVSASQTNGSSGTNGAPFGLYTESENERKFKGKTAWVDGEKGRFENRFGRLVVDESGGKSRYINNSFWANLSAEVEDLKGILNQSSDEEEDHVGSSPGVPQPNPSTHHGFMFGFSSQNVDMLALHPMPSQIQTYWEIYKDRVDPLVKVLHIPTLEPTILSSASHLANLSRGFECLLFTIYYAAATSLSAADCMTKFGEDKSVLLTRYRFAIEQALARASFLTTEEIVVVQAFVVFLICLRRNSDARVIWTLTGLVVRIAQTIGIHRDGAHFGLPPFEVEMRRRLWWQVCILDVRASEDHGCDPTIVEQSYDTKMPLNINDVDISPEMKDYPPERQGYSDLSFSLLRFEVTNTFRRVNYIPPGPSKTCIGHLTNVTLQDKERWITECHQKLEARYLSAHCDMSVPLHWVTATVARLMMSKLWLMVYHPLQRIDGGATLSPEMKDKLFITSLENIEYSLLLETEARTMKWGWLFRTYMQWHALAFMLSELCHRTTGDIVERAWVAVEKTRDGRWGVNITDESNTGHLWRPLKKLYRKAKDARQRGLQEEHFARQQAASIPTRTYSPNANPMFGHPQRPRMTRAPLSQAQLQRFSEGPTYGQTPLDKHELLRSPSLSDSNSTQTLDTASMDIDRLPQPHARPQNQTFRSAPDVYPAPNNIAFSPFNVSQPSPSTKDLLATGPGFGEHFLGNSTDIDFNSFPTDNMNNPTIPLTGDAMRNQSIDSLDGDLMDTTGNLNWENWDQLVRQYGLDGDLGGGSTNWGAPSWDAANGANMRTGFGMNGGDLF